MQKFGGKFGNFQNIWKKSKFGKKIWKFKYLFWKSGEKKLETLKKFGNLLYIWKQFGNLENIRKFRKKNWKFGKKFGNLGKK